MRRLRKHRTLITGAVILFILSSVSLIHIAGGPSKLAYYIIHLDVYALLAMATLLLGEIIRAVRLSLFSRFQGVEVSFSVSLLSRLMGRFFGVLTPAYSGATPTRAAVLSSYTGVSVGKALAITTMESLFDVFLPVSITLVLTIPFLPETWLPFSISLLIAFLWLGGLGWARSTRFVGLLEKILKGRRRRYICYLLDQRELFFKTLSELGRTPLLLVTAFILTIIAHIVESISILVISKGLLVMINPQSIVKAFLAMEISNVMVMAPTPGGALFFEYGLVGVLSSGVLVTWRLTFIIFSLLPGLLLFTVGKKAKQFIDYEVRKEALECDQWQNIRHARPPTRV